MRPVAAQVGSIIASTLVAAVRTAARDRYEKSGRPPGAPLNCDCGQVRFPDRNALVGQRFHLLLHCINLLLLLHRVKRQLFDLFQ